MKEKSVRGISNAIYYCPSGFNLPAKFVIHAAGPIYREWNKNQNEKHLFNAYTNSLIRAVDNQCKSIAFPMISSGIYGYPKNEALQVATKAIQDFLLDRDIDVTLVVFDKSSFAVSKELLGNVESYIDEHYVDTHQLKRCIQRDRQHQALYEAEEQVSEYIETLSKQMPAPAVSAPVLLDDLIGNLDESFSQMLFRLIDAKGMTDVEVYKRANLDRKLFSKIRSNKDYMPSKRTAIALAVALELSLEETDTFLERAGYALSHAVKFDVIVEYFLINKKYNIFEINEVLFEYDQPLLGG